MFGAKTVVRTARRSVARTARKKASKGVAPSAPVREFLGESKSSKITSKAQEHPRVQRSLKRVEKAYASGGIEGPLTEDQKKFAKSLARNSGMSPRLAAAWVI